MLRWACRMAVLCAVVSSTGCASAFVRGGAGFDAGTLGVGGVETGAGGQIEALGYARSGGTGLGLGVALEAAGYTTDGDADPIAFTTLEVRYRRIARAGERHGPYWEVGTGAGLAWAPGIQRAALPLQGEVGYQSLLGEIALSVGVRERFLGLVGTGSPPWDAFNSVQVVVGIGF